MRQTFFKELYKAMSNNPQIWVLTGDLGYGGFDRIRDEFPNRFVNCGAAEQAMIGIACGLALEGKIPFVYSITNFLLYRPYELIRNYVHHESINVKLVGSGRDYNYAHDGFSHHSPEAREVLNTLPNIVQMWPMVKEEIPNLVKEMVSNNTPTFISLRR